MNPAAETRESRPPEKLTVGSTDHTEPIDRARPAACSAASAADRRKEARRGCTSLLTASVWRRDTSEAPAVALATIAVPGATLLAPRIGVVSPRNQPVAAWIAQPWGSATGATPANRGSAPSRFDQTKPASVRTSYSLAVAIESLTMVSDRAASSCTAITNGGLSSARRSGSDARASPSSTAATGGSASPTTRSQPVIALVDATATGPRSLHSGQRRRSSAGCHSAIPTTPSIRASATSGSA